MAFQAGDIKISGTLDELSFYHSIFGWLVRRKGGPTRKQFKTAPAFARSRENSEEFTACARTAAVVRLLVITQTGQKDKTLYRRLMKLMRLLANEDTTALRGKRDPKTGMNTAAGHTLLKNFQVTGDLSLYNILIATDFLQRPVQLKLSADQVNKLRSDQNAGLSHTKNTDSAAIKRRRTNKKISAPRVHKQKQVPVIKSKPPSLPYHPIDYAVFRI